MTNHTLVDQQILDTSVFKWGKAKKTKGMAARPNDQMFSQIPPAVRNKLQLITLEGPQPLNIDFSTCVGNSGDVWQQAQAGIEKKYIEEEICPDGLTRYSPKPENEVECFQYLGDFSIYIQGNWGSTIQNVGQNLQMLKPLDWVCRKPDEPTDQWVVDGARFSDTYELI